MSFFSLTATCAICGEEIGLNRFRIGKTLDGKDIWECASCARQGKGKLIQIDYKTGTAFFLSERDTEIRKKCNTCGHIFCYTLYDLERNREKAKSAQLSSIAGIAGAIGGAYTASAVNSSNARNALNSIVDYNRCPHCGSTDIRNLNENEWAAEQAKVLQGGTSSSPFSAADELKKFKELLDIGAISQEEFDAKKKQLLNL